MQRKLISNHGRYPPVALDLDVEFDALVTHVRIRIPALATWWLNGRGAK